MTDSSDVKWSFVWIVLVNNTMLGTTLFVPSYLAVLVGGAINLVLLYLSVSRFKNYEKTVEKIASP